MNQFKKLYTENINGIIFTLLFHILIFLFLNFGQYKVKQVFNESEIIIDFPISEIQEKIQEKEFKNNTIDFGSQRTNIGSNKAESNKNQNAHLNNEFENELKKAENLVRDVSKQLSKEIPIVPDLKMPVKTSSGTDKDTTSNKTFTGDSNIEYFLEKRYHISLPIPVYLTQYGGVVIVNIQVNSNGTVVKAEPTSVGNSNELMLSYAKTAAIRTKFNAIENTNQLQKGYIKYRFIAQ